MPKSSFQNLRPHNHLIDIVFHNSVSGHQYQKAFFDKIAKAVFTVLSKSRHRRAVFALEDKNLGFSVNVIGERRMRFLNKKHRGKNKVADVLSFPLYRRTEWNKKIKGKSRAKKDEPVIIELGDIFVCLSAIREQDQLPLLIIHSILHLLGFDHKRVEDRKEMERLEKRILTSNP